jgi:two-component system, NarL family, response regulator LiaR
MLGAGDADAKASAGRVMMAPQQPLDLGRSAGEELHAAGHPRVRALVADQDSLARRMMQDVLQDVAGLVVIGGARDGREAVELARYYRPDVLLVDIALPPAGGVELIRQVVPILHTRIVTVSAAADIDEAVLAALHAGAVGHIDKDVEPDEFVRLVILASGGEAIVPTRVMTRLLELWREIPAGGWRPLQSTLTTREWQIVDLLGEGASTEAIAERLVLSPTTVYSHVHRVLHKLGVHSRWEAVAAAQRLRQQEASIESPQVTVHEADQLVNPIRTPRNQ